MPRELKNYMEICVDTALESVLSSLQSCTCENCTTDIRAIALNNLPPKYIATDKGQLYSKIYSIQQQFEVDIISAITNAAFIVSKNPRHTS